jgi:hypothetical protein
MSKYEKYNNDQLEELFSNYLIDSWSYSKVSSFARNEKGFEMTYIYNHKYKQSATTIAGNAYHEGLRRYFGALMEGEILDIIEVENIAFEYIEERPAYVWKIQKTTPSVEECIIKANKTASTLIKNFFKEESVYTSNLKEILAVETYIDTWLTINEVDIPLPCHMQIDMVIRTNDGKVVVIDHKSKAKFTDEKESSLTIGKQAVTYAKGYEKKSGIKVDEVWFVENKHSQNKDKSPQLLPITVKLDKDTVKYYECMLYIPLKRMIEAVSDPDYEYMINDNDNFIDLAELYHFWNKTMVADISDFDIKDSKKPLIAKRLRKIKDIEVANINPKVIANFKKNAAKFITYDFNTTDMTKPEKIEHILNTFGIKVKVVHEFSGYSSDTYLLAVGIGMKISNVISRKMDIANALDVSSVRINDKLLVYEGRSFLSIEISKKRDKDLIYDEKHLSGMKIPIGVDNFNKTVIWDLENHSSPHMLICGATGSGKSVSLISTIAYAKKAGIEDMIIFDPKFEFRSLNLTGVEIYSDIEDIEAMMELLVADMQERVKSGNTKKTLIIFDEFADAVANSKKGNELKVYQDQVVGNYANGTPKYKKIHVETKNSLEQNLKILLQKGRSVGFRIIAATQRASVKVITGDAKVNFPVQVCFRVPKEVDSKVVLDEAGAESLAGAGDGLMRSPEYMGIVRFQGFYKE